MALLALGTFAVGTDAFVVAGFLPTMAADLGVSLATAGQSVTVFAITYALASPVISTLTASLARHRLLVISLGILAAANVGTALAPTFAVLMASRMVAAIGAAAFTPNAGAVASSLVSTERRGRALAIVVSGLSIATAVGVPLGNLASQWMGWRTALTLVALLCVAVAVGLWLLLPRLAGGPRLPLRARLEVLNNPAVRSILPVTILGMTAAYTAYAYAVHAFAAVGIAAQDSQWLLFLYGVGAVVGTRVSGRLTDRYGGARVLTAGYVVMASVLVTFGVLAAGHLSAPVVAAVLAFGWGASSWCQTPPQQHRLITAAPDSASFVTSLNSSSIYIGIGLGTLIGGLAGTAGTAWLFFSGAIISVLAGLFLTATGLAARSGRHPGEA